MGKEKKKRDKSLGGPVLNELGTKGKLRGELSEAESRGGGRGGTNLGSPSEAVVGRLSGLGGRFGPAVLAL